MVELAKNIKYFLFTLHIFKKVNRRIKDNFETPKLNF